MTHLGSKMLVFNRLMTLTLLALKEEVQEHSRKTILGIDMIETVEYSMKKANIINTKKKR